MHVICRCLAMSDDIPEEARDEAFGRTWMVASDGRDFVYAGEGKWVRAQDWRRGLRMTHERAEQMRRSLEEAP